MPYVHFASITQIVDGQSDLVAREDQHLGGVWRPDGIFDTTQSINYGCYLFALVAIHIHRAVLIGPNQIVFSIWSEYKIS